jgi:Transglutaminase-like superfamily
MSAVTPVDLDRLAPIPRLRLTLEVVTTYLRVRWLMRRDEPERAVRALRARAARSPAPLGAGMERENEVFVAWRLSRAMEKVLARLPSDSRCLFSSLTLMCMLERRGISQRLVIAVRPQPFGAHAWVEVEGEAVLPDADPGYERISEL